MRNTVVVVLVVTTALLFGYAGFIANRQPDDQPEEPIEQPANQAPLMAEPVASGPEKTSTEKGRQVEVQDLAPLQQGDTLTFYIPQEDLEYSGIIETTGTTDAGNRTIIGNFLVKGSAYRFVFTLGQQFTFGTLHTPAGRYQLEAKNGQGMIISTAAINRDRDFSKPDYVIPESVRPPKS